MPRESTLLVVDDEPAILDTYCHDLVPSIETELVRSSRTPPPVVTPVGDVYRILVADTGEKAVQIVEQEAAAGRRISAGFFDMKMPGGIDGLETMSRIRKLDGDVLCCVVTAFQDRSLDDINRLFVGREDEWDYLNKPFTQLEIRQKARNLVSSWWRRRLEDQHRRDLERLVADLTSLRALRASDVPTMLDHAAQYMVSFAGAGGLCVVAAIDEDGRLVAASPPGQEARRQGGSAIADRLARPELGAAVRRAIERNLLDGEGNTTVVPFVGLSPPRLAILFHAGPLPDERRKLLAVFAENAVSVVENQRLYGELRDLNASLEDKVAAQVQDIRDANERLHEAARTDPLTAVGNRLRLREDLEVLRSRVLRYGHQYCAVLCDVDHFKLYNDHYGHIAGDEALLQVVNAIRATVRGGDMVYRFGGEEFLVIVPEQTIEGAVKAAERIRRGVEQSGIAHAGLADGKVVTISAGIAALPPGQRQPITEWLKRADAALYEAKAAGRNRVVAWNAGEGGGQEGDPEPEAKA